MATEHTTKGLRHAAVLTTLAHLAGDRLAAQAGLVQMERLHRLRWSAGSLAWRVRAPRRCWPRGSPRRWCGGSPGGCGLNLGRGCGTGRSGWRPRRRDVSGSLSAGPGRTRRRSLRSCQRNHQQATALSKGLSMNTPVPQPPSSSSMLFLLWSRVVCFVLGHRWVFVGPDCTFGDRITHWQCARCEATDRVWNNINKHDKGDEP